MESLSSHTIRQRFLAFFAKRGHAVLPSAPLIPENDSTVLFTTAGMQPLVPYLLGQPHPEGVRLASVQKCVRTQDIEEVGDNRHDTFFEMLGNWSLGDYFKKESLRWSFEFLISEDEGLGFDPANLYVTVFAGNENAPRDEEAIGIWQELFGSVGISAQVDCPIAEGGRIFTTVEDNWWGPAGQTGPCGPDSEIHYDTGQGNLTDERGFPNFESGRVVEIWNNVFMQYEKTASSEFVPLQQHNVDTGMGLERVAMIAQGVPTIFETDLFAPLIQELHKVLPEAVKHDERVLRIIADHFRTATMLIADGVLPSNKDRGYILRRLIRRATLHMAQSGTDWVEPTVATIAQMYASQYPRIETVVSQIVQSVAEEVSKFQRTLEKGKAEIEKRATLTGKDAFDLYQTYGFPLELTKEYAATQGVTFDETEFDEEFRKHQELSRTASAGQFASGLADHSDATIRYHTATHLLHQALRNILGPHVQQKGSNITPERLRFDFSHPEKVTPEQLEAVTLEVNTQINAALPVSTQVMTPDDAQKVGAIGLFGHKYGDTVSVYSIGNYSREICTGPHVANTAELGEFTITKEESVSAGVRRIKAVLK